MSLCIFPVMFLSFTGCITPSFGAQTAPNRIQLFGELLAEFTKTGKNKLEKQYLSKVFIKNILVRSQGLQNV